MSELLERLGTFAAQTATRPLAPEVLHHAKRAVIDWYAAAIPGAVAAPTPLVERAIAEDLDRGDATLVLGRRATVRGAALVNGTAAHTVEFDDIFKDGIYHPGAPTIPAALAFAQARGASGERFLRAVIAGYEISTRIGSAMGRAHYERWHNTGTIGCFGAVPAAGLLLGLDAHAHAHALATVATFAAGLQQAFRMDSHSKPLHAGRAAEAGVLAAQLAAQGVIGSLDVLDGEVGFGRAMGAGPDWDAAFATLGRDYNITRMTFKNHGCCGHSFAAIDAARALAAELGAAPEAIESIRIGAYRATLDVADIRDPRTAAEAKFSTRYTVAHALVRGGVRLDAYDDDHLADPRIRALARRIDVMLDPAIDAAFPRQRAAHVTMTLRDGRTATHFQPARIGDPELPLDDAALEAKLVELAGPVVGVEAARSLAARLWRLDAAASIDFTRHVGTT